MLQTRIRTRLAVVATAAGIAVAGATAVLAATTATIVPVGGQAPTLQIEAGRVLEMTIDTAMSKPEYSWILTRDRKFINAQRSRFFQTRQTVPAAYVLDVNIQDTVNNQTEYRVFNVVVNPATDTPRTKRQTEGELRAVLTADLWNGQDTIMLPPEGGIVRLDMQQSVGDIASFSLDLDTGVDSDGDGDLENDKDNALTAGEKDATPLYVYMLPKSTPRRVILTVTNPDNTQTSKAILNVSFTGQQAQPPTPGTTPGVTPPPVAVGNNSILAEKRGLTVTFSGRIDQTIRATRELLLEWDFGDRSRSLLNSPVHTYVKNGVYTVNLTVKDIATGEILLTGSETIQVQADQPTTPTAPSTPGTTPTTPVKVTPTATTKSGGSIGSIIKVIFIVFFLIALAVGMFFILRWLKNKTTGKLQQTLDKMENTIVEKQEEKESQKKATTMKLKKEKKTEKTEVVASEPAPAKAEEVSAKETAKSDLKTGEAALASAPLASQDAPIPDWLKGDSSPAPVAEPVATPAPAPVVPEPAPLATQDAPVPDWLKPQAPQATQTEPAATPPMEPLQPDPAAIPDWLKGPPATTAATHEPPPATPAPSPAPEAVAPLASQDAPVPDWLKPVSTTQAPSPAPAPVIEPKPLETQSAPVPDWLQPIWYRCVLRR
jgi:PKD repeat protein